MGFDLGPPMLWWAPGRYCISRSYQAQPALYYGTCRIWFIHFNHGDVNNFRSVGLIYKGCNHDWVRMRHGESIQGSEYFTQGHQRKRLSPDTRLLSKPPFVISGYVRRVSAVISVIKELDLLKISSMEHDWQVLESVAAVELMIRSKKNQSSDIFKMPVNTGTVTHALANNNNMHIDDVILPVWPQRQEFWNFLVVKDKNDTKAGNAQVSAGAYFKHSHNCSLCVPFVKIYLH